MMDEPKPRKKRPAMKLWHASRTPEQRAAWREKVSIGTSVGMDMWHAQRTQAERDKSRQLITDAAVARMWIRRQPGAGTKFLKGHAVANSNSPEALALRTMNQIQKASVARILKDIVRVQPELIRDAIIEGLQAPPPRSFPYIALAAAYLDGKPVDAPPVGGDNREDLSELTRDQLLARALNVANQLQREHAPEPALPVIDIVAEPEPSK
ncbi:MAG TPA: hypothetical protein VNJ02_18505 [Vicinamibacterales bacterium]|nr:hypothetical protein [Vicinamibacterales bacterium]